MAHETASFYLHRTASFRKRRYWVVILGSETASSSAFFSSLNETTSSSAKEIRIFLILPSASYSSSRSCAFS
jgi:hypothetical protein